MKTIIMFLCLSMFSFIASAQATEGKHTVSNPLGRVVDTGIDSMTWTKPSSQARMSVHIVVTKDSGTVSATSVLYHSNYPGGPFHSTGDTLTSTNVAVNSKFIELTNPQGLYWLIKTTGSGTMAAKTKSGISY